MFLQLKFVNHKNITFCRLFDATNSKRGGCGYKAALSPANFHLWRNFLIDSKEWLINLSFLNKNGVVLPLIKSRKQTFVRGLYITVSSMLDIYEDLVKSSVLR